LCQPKKPNKLKTPLPKAVFFRLGEGPGEGKLRFRI
jgi:hypothetical protein